MKKSKIIKSINIFMLLMLAIIMMSLSISFKSLNNQSLKEMNAQSITNESSYSEAIWEEDISVVRNGDQDSFDISTTIFGDEMYESGNKPATIRAYVDGDHSTEFAETDVFMISWEKPVTLTFNYYDRTDAIASWDNVIFQVWSVGAMDFFASTYTDVTINRYSEHNAISSTSPSPEEITIGETSVSINIKVDSNYAEDDNVKPYVVYVVDGSGKYIGDDDFESYTTVGNKTIDITGLEEKHEYKNCSIAIADASDVYTPTWISSEEFGFFTSPDYTIINSVEYIEETDIDDSTVSLIVNIEKNDSSKPLDDYDLIVGECGVGTHFQEYGYSWNLTTDGRQEIIVGDLLKQYNYENFRVKAASSEDHSIVYAESEEFSFIINDGKKADTLTTPDEGDMSIGKTTAEFTTDVSSSESLSKSLEVNENELLNDYILQVLDSDGELLGDKMEKDIFSDTGKHKTYVRGLEPGTLYSDVTIVAFPPVYIIGEVGTTEKFSFRTQPDEELYIDGIDEVSITDDKSVTTTSQSFTIDLTTLISEPFYSHNVFRKYDIVVLADHDDKKDDVIYSLNDQIDYKENFLMEVTGLKANTMYSNIRVKLIDSETKEILGSESEILGDVFIYNETLVIDNAEIISSTSNEFKFKINTKYVGIESSTPSYKIQTIANTSNKDDEVIWESDEQTTVGEKTFNVKNLNKDEKFSDIRFKIVSPLSNSLNDDEKTFGNQFDTKFNLITTDDTVKEIKNDSPKILNVNNDSFKISLDINSNKGSETVFPYKIIIFSNESVLDPIWTSEELFYAKDNLELTIDGLKSNTNYTNLNAQIVDVNSGELYGSKIHLIDSLKTKKFNSATNIGIYSGISLSMILVIAFISIVIIYSIKRTKKVEEKFDYSYLVNKNKSFKSKKVKTNKSKSFDKTFNKSFNSKKTKKSKSNNNPFDYLNLK